MASAPEKLGFAPEKLGFAPEKLGFALEKLGFASERHGFASERHGFATEKQGFGFSENAFDPKMVFGPNLHLMAPFELLEAGFCTEFRHASFVFSRPEADFWTPDLNFGIQGSTCWAGDPFWSILGSQKLLLWRNHFVVRL